MNFNKKQWHTKVSCTLWEDKITINKEIGTSPYKLVYGKEDTLPLILELNSSSLAQKLEFKGVDQREIRMVDLVNLEESRNSAMIKLEQHQQATNKWFGRKVRPQVFKFGDMVFKRDSYGAKIKFH